MEFRQLEAFFHVAELGSFTRAATVLDTTQPALSRLVRQLETELAQVLLLRNGRGVTLSDAGQVLLKHASGIVQQLARARQDMDDLRGQPGGQFSIGLLPTVARLAATPLVQEFQRNFPKATISIVEGLSTHLSEWLTLGRIDVATLYDRGETPLLESRPLLEQELYLVGPPLSAAIELPPVPFAQLADFRLVTPSRMHGVRQTLEALAAERGVSLTIALEVDSVGAILDLVHRGIGYTVQPLNPVLSDRAQRSFSIRRIVTPTPKMHLVLATSRRHYASKLATQALELVHRRVLECFGTDMQKGNIS
jgi:LysR family transcriptional regulator, nitrogen assimilation regulatory protein